METVLRVILIYLTLMIGLRILGKRELSDMSPFDLVTLLLLPEIVSQSLVREASITNTMIGVTTLFCLVFLTSTLSHRLPRVGRLIEGRPTVLVRHGQLLVGNLNRERVEPDELFAELHMAGLERLAQVQWAILETDGKIAIIPVRAQDRQITANRRQREESET